MGNSQKHSENMIGQMGGENGAQICVQRKGATLLQKTQSLANYAYD